MTEEPEDKKPMSAILVIAGGGALLAAAIIDAASVVGRHVGLPFLGSIELVQAAILIAGSSSLVAATLAGSHAIVRLVFDRLPERFRHNVASANRLAAVAFFLGLLAGSIWITADMWGGHEESELLRIPYAPLRIVSCASLTVVAVIFLARALKRSRKW
jgi:TRAP-type C4-dicarboxylate transport system permease small subunit